MYIEITLGECSNCNKESVPVKDGLCLSCRKGNNNGN